VHQLILLSTLITSWLSPVINKLSLNLMSRGRYHVAIHKSNERKHQQHKTTTNQWIIMPNKTFKLGMSAVNFSATPVYFFLFLQSSLVEDNHTNAMILLATKVYLVPCLSKITTWMQLAEIYEILNYLPAFPRHIFWTGKVANVCQFSTSLLVKKILQPRPQYRQRA